MHRIGFQIVSVIAGIMVIASFGLLLHGQQQLERLGSEIDDVYQASLTRQAETFITRLAKEQANRYDARFGDYLLRAKLLAAALKVEYENMDDLPEFGGYDPAEFSIPHGNGIWTQGLKTEVASIYFGGDELTDEALRDLRALAGVDALMQETEAVDDLTTATWTISAVGGTTYSPNVDPAKFLPEGFDFRRPEHDPAYSFAAPAWNPERKARFGKLYNDPARNGVTVSAVAPVYTDDGVFRATVGIDIALREMRQEVLEFHGLNSDEGSRGFAFLIGGDGRAIAFPEDRLKLIGLERQDDLLRVNLRLNLLLTRAQEFTEVAGEMVAGRSGVRWVPMGDEVYYVAYHPMPSTGWSLGLAYPERDLLQASEVTQVAIQDSLTRNSTNGALVAFGGLVVMGALITLFVNRRLVGPILRLNASAQAIGNGDLDRDIPAKGRDELADFARNLLVMRDSVKRSLTRLADSERLLSAIINNASALIYLKDTQRRYILVNRSFAELYGLQPDDFKGRTDADMIPRLSGRFKANEDTVLSNGRALELEEDLVHDDGTVHSYISMKFPLRGEDGDIYAVCGISTDITERKRADQERITEENKRKSAEETRDYLRGLNAKIEEKSRQVRILLDNSGQGFFSFGPDMMVEPEYSREGERIFAGSPAGKPIGELLFPEQLDKQEFFETAVRRAMGARHEGQKSVYLSLLPPEYVIRARSYRAEYKLVEDGNVILMLTDITQEKALQDQAEKERQRLEFVVAVVSESRDVFELLDEFQRFIDQEASTLLDGPGRDEEKLAELYRLVHTFKGGFDQFDFPRLPKALHEIEVVLAELGNAALPPGAARMRALIMRGSLASALKSDLALLVEVLGQSFLDGRGQVHLEKVVLEELIADADRLLGQPGGPATNPDVKMLLLKLRRIGQVDIKSLLAVYEGAVQRIADRLGKEAKAEIIGDMVPVDPERMTAFDNALVHVIRNAVDHGIEDPEARAEMGKEVQGTVTCQVFDQGDEVMIRISDDGAGIDLDKVREAAVARGMATQEEADALRDHELFDLLFTERFTTRTQVTGLSGRGVGLSAVRAEVEKLGGRIEVGSEAGTGAWFSFTIPLTAEERRGG